MIQFRQTAARLVGAVIAVSLVSTGCMPDALSRPNREEIAPTSADRSMRSEAARPGVPGFVILESIAVAIGEPVERIAVVFDGPEGSGVLNLDVLGVDADRPSRHGVLRAPVDRVTP